MGLFNHLILKFDLFVFGLFGLQFFHEFFLFLHARTICSLFLFLCLDFCLATRQKVCFVGSSVLLLPFLFSHAFTELSVEDRAYLALPLREGIFLVLHGSAISFLVEP
jgi:hypothetical protein